MNPCGLRNGPMPTAAHASCSSSRTWRKKRSGGCGMPSPRMRPNRMPRTGRPSWTIRSRVPSEDCSADRSIRVLRYSCRVRHFRENIVVMLALAAEVGEHLPVQFPAPRQLDPQRIDEMAVDDDLVVQMRPGGEAGRAEKADDLALPNPRPGRDPLGIGRHVIVGRHIAVG